MTIVNVSNEALAGFGSRPVHSTHVMHRNSLFSDEVLAEVLDAYPREHLYALTMGTDNTRTDENRLALHDDVSGTELLRAVRNGRIWINLTQLHRADGRYRSLINELFRELCGSLVGVVPIEMLGTLLISSPNVLVYYHADALPSVLWHLRGRKRVWVYPANDERFMSRHDLEDIYAGIRHEYLPFDPSFDRAATVYDLEPGDWISWPRNAPHRVANFDSVNVSLSTEYVTRQSRALTRIYLANRYFRTRFRQANLSVREDGPCALLKTVVHRIARRAGLDPLKLKRHVPVLRIDADAPGGVISLDQGSPSSCQ